MRTRHGLCAVSFLVALVASSQSHADLQDDVTLLIRRYKDKKLFHLGPRILEQADELPLLVPDNLVGPGSNSCLHLIALAAQSVQFLLDAPSSDDSTEDSTFSSRAGLVETVRCGSDKAAVAAAALTMASPRGAVDIIGFSDNQPAPVALRVLPWRAAGDEAPEQNLTHWAAPSNLAARLAQLEQRAAFRGANRTERRIVPGEELQSGEILVGFDPGCHEVQMVSESDAEHPEFSVQNPELVWTDDGQAAASDWSNALSPAFHVCTAVARIAKITFDACPKNTQAVLFRSHFPWPAGIPSNWAIQARDQMALALVRRHLPSLPTLPAKSWIGSSSATSLHAPVAPRSCYLAIAATSQGPVNEISLAASSESRWIADSSIDAVGASVAFCVSQATSIKLDIDARGADVVWILGLWSIASGPLFADYS
jgi:hypothetical protein